MLYTELKLHGYLSVHKISYFFRKKKANSCSLLNLSYCHLWRAKAMLIPISLRTLSLSLFAFCLFFVLFFPLWQLTFSFMQLLHHTCARVARATFLCLKVYKSAGKRHGLEHGFLCTLWLITLWFLLHSEALMLSLMAQIFKCNRGISPLSTEICYRNNARLHIKYVQQDHTQPFDRALKSVYQHRVCFWPNY